MDNKLKTAARPRSYVGLSLVILVLVVASAAGLATVNKGLSAQVAQDQDALSALETKIAALKADKTVVLSDVILASRAQVAKAVSISRVQDYVVALSLLEAKYGVSFDGFSFQSGRITTSVVAASADKNGAIVKLRDLIKAAREGTGGLVQPLDNGNVVKMDLGKVTFISGDDSQRVASVTFDVVSSPKN